MGKTNLKNDVIFSIACLLLCSFLLHTLLFNHQHPSFMGDGIQTAVHGEDKKWLGALAGAFILFALEIARELPTQRFAIQPLFAESPTFPAAANRRDPNLRQIASGIIHSKIYA